VVPLTVTTWPSRTRRVASPVATTAASAVRGPSDVYRATVRLARVRAEALKQAKQLTRASLPLPTIPQMSPQ